MTKLDDEFRSALVEQGKLLREIAKSQTRSDTKIEQLGDTVDELRKHLVVGNGTPGIMMQLPALETRLISVECDVSMIKDDDKEGGKVAAVTSFQVNSIWAGLCVIGASVVGVIIKTW